MDFSQGGGGGGGRTRRDGYNFCEDDEQDDPATRHPFNISSSSSSSSAAAASSSATPSSQIQKEHMFDKVVTPSDVGKLNRLVIPKQYAEKYFPLDTATHEKGLLLSFEDRTGKPWRFRYSYWNSSQSYVMTKGWSRFVKEKRLDAGDTVSFGRGVDEKDRLFIDWKRRPEIIHEPPRGPLHLPRIPLPSNYHYQHHHPMVSFARSAGPWDGRILVPQNAAVHDAHHNRQQNYLYNAAAAGGAGAGQYLVFRSAVGQQPQAAVQLGSSGGCQDGTVLGSAAAAAAAATPMVLESVPVVQIQAAAAKRMRLFGVNLDLPADSEVDPGESSVRSQASGTFSSSSSPSPRGKEKQELSLDLDM